MTDLLFYNNATTTLAAPIGPTDTTCTLASGSGSLFLPGPTGSEYFCLTFQDAATGLSNEIVHCTGVSGDTLTIVRAQEGTSAQSWNTGDSASAYVTAGMLETLATETAPRADEADKLTTARNISMTGDATWTVSFDGSTSVTAAGTLATVNSNVGTFGDGTTVASVTVNAKGLVTAASNVAIASAPKWTTARTLSFTGDVTGSNSVDGSASVATALTLATVNSTTGNFGDLNIASTITVNGKGLITNAVNTTISQVFSGITITAGGSGTQTFSISGTAPIVRITGLLVCTSADNGYSVGDEIIAPLTNDTTTNRGVIYGWNGTTVFWAVGSGGISTIPKSGGAANPLTLTKWTLTLIASRA